MASLERARAVAIGCILIGCFVGTRSQAAIFPVRVALVGGDRALSTFLAGSGQLGKEALDERQFRERRPCLTAPRRSGRTQRKSDLIAATPTNSLASQALPTPNIKGDGARPSFPGPTTISGFSCLSGVTGGASEALKEALHLDANDARAQRFRASLKRMGMFGRQVGVQRAIRWTRQQGGPPQLGNLLAERKAGCCNYQYARLAIDQHTRRQANLGRSCGVWRPLPENGAPVSRP